MGKKLINLYVPAVQERFDLKVPTDMEIKILIKLLTSGVCELCEGRFVPSGQEALALCGLSLPLHPQQTLADYGVDDGARLVLI